MTSPASFNIVIGNHEAMYRESLHDLVTIIESGLRSREHSVTYSIRDLKPAPHINLFVEYFGDDRCVDRLIRLKADDASLIFGVIGTEDVEDAYVMNGSRLAGLQRIAPHLDFVWTMTEQMDIYRRWCGHDRVALIELGSVGGAAFDAAQKDVDVLWYGREGTLVHRWLSVLRARGVVVASTGGSAPSYMRRDLLRRAKVVVDCRTHDTDRFLSPTRICAGLDAGAALVAETFDSSALSSLYAYGIGGRDSELADLVETIVAGGGWREIAAQSCQAFRAGRSMAALLETPLSVALM